MTLSDYSSIIQETLRITESHLQVLRLRLLNYADLISLPVQILSTSLYLNGYNRQIRLNIKILGIKPAVIKA